MLIGLQYLFLGNNSFGAYRTVNQVLIYCSVAGGSIFGVAHIIDFQFLKRRSGITSWIFTLLGVICLLAIAILSVIAPDTAWYYFSLSRPIASTELILAVFAVVFLALSALFAGLRSRRDG
jgi:hypothetical protein